MNPLEDNTPNLHAVVLIFRTSFKPGFLTYNDCVTSLYICQLWTNYFYTARAGQCILWSSLLLIGSCLLQQAVIEGFMYRVGGEKVLAWVGHCHSFWWSAEQKAQGNWTQNRKIRKQEDYPREEKACRQAVVRCGSLLLHKEQLWVLWGGGSSERQCLFVHSCCAVAFTP